MTINTQSVELTAGNGNLPLIKIRAARSAAEIYLHGAHVTRFQRDGEPSLLFMSRLSQFEPRKAIRGGVPICFPWFGPRQGEPAHGLARLSTWELSETSVEPDGGVKVRLRLPQKSMKPEWSALRTEFIVTVSDTLTMELATTNESADKTLEIENCLHSYFHVGDIAAVSLTGLQGAAFLDNTSNSGPIPDDAAVLKITREMDRTYLDTTKTIEIRDENFHRTIRVEKLNSKSTVVWNPWTTKKMDDFDSADHKNMVCVESGNVKANKISLAPGATTALKTILNTTPLK